MTGVTTTIVMTVLGVVAGVTVRQLSGRMAGRRPPPGRCEAACAAAGMLAATVATGAGIIAAALFGWWCVCASTVDLLARRLPNTLTLGGAAAALVAATATGHGRSALAGALLLTVPLLVAHLVAPWSLGAGDVKLALGLGAVTGTTGPGAVLLAALLPSVLTVLAALVVRLRERHRRTQGSGPRGLPHGPSMCVAAVTASILTGWPGAV